MRIPGGARERITQTGTRGIGRGGDLGGGRGREVEAGSEYHLFLAHSFSPRTYALVPVTTKGSL